MILVRMIVTLCFVAIFFNSCNKKNVDVPPIIADILTESGNNKGELEKLITHYKILGDSLKLRAAYFLIENLRGKYSIIPVNNSISFRNALFSMQIKDTIGWDPALSKVSFYLDSVSKNKSHLKYIKVEDINVITSDYLIENIDLAFKAWKRFKYASYYNFDDFCEYVLPYRLQNEPLCRWRKVAYEKNAHYLDSLSDPKLIALEIVRNFPIKYNVGISKYPYPLSYTDIDKLSVGTCEHLSSYLTFSLRGIGIPSATDFIPAWANRSSNHFWNVIIDTTKLSTDIGFNHLGVNQISYKISKIYRLSFASQIDENRNWDYNHSGEFKNQNCRDVTSEYLMPQSDIVIRNLGKFESKNVSLCTFNNKRWVPVAQSKIKNKSVFFNRIGRGIPFGSNKILEYEHEGKGIVYLPFINNGFQQTAPTNPFILNENGRIQILNPNFEKRITVKLYRKYPLYKEISKYSEEIVGGSFELSNDKDFINKKRVFTITKTPKTNVYEVFIDNKNSYRYARYVAPDNVKLNIGEISFFYQDKNLEGEYIGSDINQRTMFAFDHNIESFYYSNNSKGGWIGLDFILPRIVDKIVFSPRNDNNDVFCGDTYELFYWNKRWKSLGKTKAKSYPLIFNNVPDNALLLLHNHSRGKEERIFTYENGRQIWW